MVDGERPTAQPSRRAGEAPAPAELLFPALGQSDLPGATVSANAGAAGNGRRHGECASKTRRCVVDRAVHIDDLDRRAVPARYRAAIGIPPVPLETRA